MSGQFIFKGDTWWGWITRVSVGCTIAWAAGGLAIAVFSKQPIWTLTLNEGGDFFAGFAGPPAFYWLVLGFFQQGRELRIQAEELRESVQQFKIQSEHMGENRKHEVLLETKNQVRRLFDARHRRVAYLVEALFRVQYIGSPQSPGAITVFSSRHGFLDNPSVAGLRDFISFVLAATQGMENNHENVWRRMFTEHSHVLVDLRPRSVSFSEYVSELKNSAHHCGLDDIIFEMQWDRLSELADTLTRIVTSGVGNGNSTKIESGRPPDIETRG